MMTTKNGLTISVIFSFCIITIMIACPVISYLNWDDVVTYIGINSIILFYLYCTFILIGLVSPLGSNEFYLVFSSIVILYILQRFLTLLIDPVSKYYDTLFFPDDYFNTLLIIIFYSFVLVGGIVIGDILIPKKKCNKLFVSRKNIRNVTLYAISVFVIDLIGLFFFHLQGEEITGERVGNIGKLFSILTNKDLVFLLLMSFVFARFLCLRKVRWVPVLLFTFLYFITRAAGGSRAGIYDAIVVVFICLLSTHKNYVFRAKHFLVMVVCAVIALFSFVIGNITRFLFWKEDWTGALGSLSDWREIGQFLDWSDLVVAVSKRLSLIDPLLFVFNNKNIVPVDNYLNLNTIFISSLNRVLPGNFDKNVIISERLFAVFYSGREESSILSHFHADLYGAFGYLYLVFGLLGGALALFVSIVLLVAAYRSSRHNVWGGLILLVYYFWLLTFGLDNLIARFFYFIPVYMLSFYILRKPLFSPVRIIH